MEVRCKSGQGDHQHVGVCEELEPGALRVRQVKHAHLSNLGYRVQACSEGHTWPMLGSNFLNATEV